jgi:capsular polysaccharide biosynthesis protein
MEQDNTKNGIELDLGEVIPFLISKSVIIILFALFVGMITLAVTKIFITPTYTASTQILVLNEKGDSNSTNVDVNTLQSSTYLVQDFTVLVKSKPVLQQVKADMDLDISISDLSDKISVVIPDNTRIITIQVEDSNPLVAKQLADCVRNAAINHIQELLGADTVKNVDGENNYEKI